jgi:SAM-dependent methyltransferase
MTSRQQQTVGAPGEDMHSRTQVPPSPEEQKRYWDERWNRVKDEYPDAWARRRGAAVLGTLYSLSLQRPRILDMGCGTGWFTEELTRIGEATGIELSEAAVSLARSRYPHATFIAGNVLAVALPAAHFDVVVSLEVIAHVEDQNRYLEQAAHVLKPGGHLVITTVNKFVHDRTDWAADSPGHIRFWLDRGSFRRLLTRHGFRILRMTSVIPIGHGGILRLVNSPKLNALAAGVISARTLEALKERAGLGWTWIALARRRRHSFDGSLGACPVRARTTPECQPKEPTASAGTARRLTVRRWRRDHVHSGHAIAYCTRIDDRRRYTVTPLWRPGNRKRYRAWPGSGLGTVSATRIPAEIDTRARKSTV